MNILDRTNLVTDKAEFLENRIVSFPEEPLGLFALVLGYESEDRKGDALEETLDDKLNPLQRAARFLKKEDRDDKE